MKLVPNNIIRIPTKLDDNFFRYWFEFLQPFHKLTNREVQVLIELVKERFRLGKLISDEDIIDQVLMSDETKRKIREKCDLQLAHFQVIMSKLKKQKIIVNEKINPKYIPLITKDVEEEGSFRLLLVFEL